MQAAAPAAGVQRRVPVPQAQLPPTPEQTSPEIWQSLVLQQVPAGMQASALPQSVLPVGQTQAPATHVVPAITAQSLSKQQALLAMQLLVAVQTLFPAGHPQVPPGPEQVWPVTLQLAVVQQVVAGMQALEVGQVA